MRKVLFIIIFLIFLLIGCDKSPKPIETIQTDFDLQQAEEILKKVWKSIYEMTNTKFETKPNVKISSKEEFFKIYDFTNMNEGVKKDIYESIVRFDHGKEAKDANGNLVFGKNGFQRYIPTIYDKGVSVTKAYIKESIYNDEYSYKNKVELIVLENSNEKIVGYAEGFNRKNIFMRDDEGKWILTGIEGTIYIGWKKEN